MKHICCIILCFCTSIGSYAQNISNFCKFQIANKIQPLAYSSLTSESAFASFSFSPLPPF